jgi:hypothetical protein
VIVYVYYDDPDNTLTESRKYFHGIEVNAHANRKLYPEWRMWVYHDVAQGTEKSRCALHILPVCIVIDI